MSYEYTKSQINQLLKNEEFYRKGCLNYSGKCQDAPNLTYQEYISSYLNKLTKREFEKLLLGEHKMTPLKGSYKKLNHKADCSSYIDDNKKYNKRHEEKIAKRIVNQKNEFFEYQIPVNRQDKSLHGKVDIVGDKNNELLLVELKDNDSDENLLRAIIEIYTYFLKINNNLKKKDKRYSPDFFYYLSFKKFVSIVPCVMFFRGFKNKPQQDFDEMKKKKNNLYELSKKLGIRFFSVKDKTNSGNKQLKPDYNKTVYIISEENY